MRNVYSEPSKADDVQFTLDLIEKVGQEIPAADMDNVNIIGQYDHPSYSKQEISEISFKKISLDLVTFGALMPQRQPIKALS